MLFSKGIAAFLSFKFPEETSDWTIYWLEALTAK